MRSSPNILNEEVLKVALTKRDEILRKLEVLRSEELRREVEDVWIPYNPSPLRPESIAGVDGGEALQEFQGFTVYVIAAASMIYRLGNPAGREWLPKTVALADVDILTPPSASRRVNLYREVLEARAAAASVSEGVKLLLMDGSLRSLIIEPRPRGESGGLTFDKAAEVLRDSCGDVLKLIVRSVEEGLHLVRGGGASMITHRLVNIKDIPPRYRVDAVTAAEYVEKLAAYRALLRMSVWGGVKLVFISKRSRTTNYFEGFRRGRMVPPDIMVFQHLTREPGYSKPILPEERGGGGVRRLKQVPEVEGLMDFYSRLKVGVTYVRLVEGGPVLRVELPLIEGGGPASISEAFIKALMDLLAGVSSEGYPYPLYEADKVVRVPKSTLSIILRGLGLNQYLTGREVLEEWLS